MSDAAAAPVAPRAGRRDDLSHKELLMWGAAGGFFFVAVNIGLFDLDRINAMLEGSRPGVQIAAFTVFSVVTIAAGAVWSRVHAPLRSVIVAFQLGLVAPLALTAAVTAFADGNPGGKHAANVDAWLDGGFFVSTAHAADDQPGTADSPSTADCIVKAVIKSPC